MYMRFSVSIFVSLCCSAALLAHPGPRIWVNIDDGTITTYAGPYPEIDLSNYEPSIYFAQPLAHQGDDVWATDFPGFQRVPGGSIPSGTTFRYNIIGPLLWFVEDDPAQCPHFEPVAEFFEDMPPIPQMAVTNELFQTRITSSGFVMGDSAFAYNGGAGDHNHLTYTVMGDGTNPVGGPTGIYAIQLQLTSTGVSPSETFYLLLGKGVSTDDLTNALDFLQHPRVPPDLDCDRDVDLDDFELFGHCYVGPSAPVPSDMGLEYCQRADFDMGMHVDIGDFAIFQTCFSGEGAIVQDGC